MADQAGGKPPKSAKPAKAAKSTRATPGRRCPICGKAAVAEFQPFCSARCTDVDLNRWFSGVYAIPTAEPPADEDETDN